eukprot:scaffold10785_cov114-Isochrysis_galbana.AAC.6
MKPHSAVNEGKRRQAGETHGNKKGRTAGEPRIFFYFYYYYYSRVDLGAGEEVPFSGEFHAPN